MSNSKTEKVNKNPDKIRKDVVAIILIFALIGAYIFYECYSATHVDVETISAVTSTVYESVETKALVVRDEHLVKDSGGAVTVPCVSDGEKVKLGGNIAMIFSSEENAKNYSNSIDLQEQLEYYNELESKAAGIATDVASIDKDILSDINDYVRLVNTASFSSLSSCCNDLNDKLTRRQMIIGQDIDFSSVKENLQSQIDAINIDSCKPTGYVTTDESGIFSSYTDGYEDAFDYDKITSIDIDTLKSYIENTQSSQPQENCIGKLIISYDWYFCCVLSADDVKGIDNGDDLNIALKDSDKVINCEVVSGADIPLGQSETVLILKCSQIDAEITSMRIEDIEIRFNEYSGFKVPSSAVHVDEDGNKCVYALVANQVAKRQGKIIYSTKDYVVFERDTQNSDSIRFYDRIITKGKDLHDGKVYS